MLMGLSELSLGSSMESSPALASGFSAKDRSESGSEPVRRPAGSVSSISASPCSVMSTPPGNRARVCVPGSFCPVTGTCAGEMIVCPCTCGDLDGVPAALLHTTTAATAAVLSTIASEMDNLVRTACYFQGLPHTLYHCCLHAISELLTNQSDDRHGPRANSY